MCWKSLVKGILVSCDWLVSVRVKCDMLNFGAVKCDLFYTREMSFSIKMLRKMRIIGATL